ncbi:MAG: hypothetical protein QW273_01555, partial [Candidatus Pacearchaeota archaeon]
FLQEALLFILVYVLVFAILQKSKILGDNVSKINSLVAFSFSLIFVGYSFAQNIISNIIPFVAIGLSVLLMVFLFFGFVGGEIDKMDSKLKKFFLWVSLLFLLMVILSVSGFFNFIKNSSIDFSVVYSIILIVLVILVIVYVVSSTGKSDK